MQTVLRGAKFRPFDAQVALLKLKAGDAVELRPEPTNRFDPNAIQVIAPAAGDEPEAFVGYVAKEDCEDVLAMMAMTPVLARILEENGNSPTIEIFHDFDGTQGSGPEAA